MKNVFNIQLVAYLDNGADFSKVKEELSSYLKDNFLSAAHVFEARIENEPGLCVEYHGEIKDSTHLGEIVDYISNDLNLSRVVIIESNGLFVPSYGFYFSEEYPVLLIMKFIHDFYERALETMKNHCNVVIGTDW